MATTDVITLGNLATFKQQCDLTYQGKMTIDSSLSTSSTNCVQNNVITTKLNEVEAIAKGAVQAIGYATYQAMITALNAMDDDELLVGQSVYIATTDVIDLWVSSVSSTSSAYTYSSDSNLMDDLESNGFIQVGYYILRALETGKVSLTGYVTQSQLESELASYVTTSALTTTLGSYATQNWVTTTLVNYVTSSSLTSTLADYVQIANIDNYLGNYVTGTALTTALADYVTIASLQTISGAKTFTSALAVQATTTARSIEPETTATYNLGSSTKVWNQVYAGTITDGTNSITVANIVAKQDALTFASNSDIEALFS